MLDMPWVVAPRDLKAGDVITLGRAARKDIELTVAAAVPAGTLLGVATDGRLHPLPTPKPERKTRHALPASAGTPHVARRAGPARNG